MSAIFSRPIFSMPYHKQVVEFDKLSVVTQTLGFTEFSRFRSYEMYNQVNKRIDLIESFIDELNRDLYSDPSLMVSPDFVDGLSVLHDDLVLAYDVRAQLDINNTIDNGLVIR